MNLEKVTEKLRSLQSSLLKVYDFVGKNKWKVERRVKHISQILVRGWADSDNWNLDHSMAVNIYPRLKEFRESGKGSVPGYFVKKNGDIDEKGWEECLDKMVESFRIMAEEEGCWSCSVEEQKKIQEGLDLFAKYYLALWV